MGQAKDSTGAQKPDHLQLDAENFAPPAGTIRQQVEMQLAFLTKAVVDSSVLCSGLFEPDVAPPEPVFRARAAAPRTPRNIREFELGIAARMAEASAKLIAAYAKVHGHFEQRYTVHHLHKIEGDGTKRKVSRLTHVIADIPPQEIPPEVAAAVKKEEADIEARAARRAAAPPPSQTGGSNGGA
jgi:hypothetical protein